MEKPSTSRGAGGSNQRPKSKRAGQRQESQDDDEAAYGEMMSSGEPGFIARTTGNSRYFIDAYHRLVKIYPDIKDNFEVKLTKLLEIYMDSVIDETNADTVMAINFPRASLVVQGSTRIYAKKVDMLVDLTLKLLGFVNCGIAQQQQQGEGEEDAEEAGPAHGHKRVHKDPAFDFIDMKPSKNSFRQKPERTPEKKLRFLPKCFPALVRPHQSAIDKKRIATLNPSFTGDKTSYRLWGPICGDTGLLVADLGNTKHKFEVLEESRREDEEDNWDDDLGLDLGAMESTPEPVADEEPPTPAASTVETAVAHEAEAPTREEIVDAAEEDKENTEAPDPWQEMPLEAGVQSRNLDPKIKIAPPKSKATQDIHDDFISRLMKKVKNSCFGDEGNIVGEDLKDSDKMLPDSVKPRRKRGVPSMASTQAEVDAMDLFAEHDSDAEDVAGFDPDGNIVYVPREEVTTAAPTEVMNESAAPDVDISEWGAPDSDGEDNIASLPGPRLTVAPEADKDNNYILTELPEDTDLAGRLESWYKMIHKEQKLNAAKPQFTFNAYCQEVLQRFPEDQDTLHFKEIAEGLPAGQTARYLLATLQLANTNNVEIRGLVAGEVANDNMEVVLLNKTRVLPSFEDDIP